MKKGVKTILLVVLTISTLLNVYFIKSNLNMAFLREEPKNYKMYILYKEYALETKDDVILIKNYEGEILGAGKNLSEGIKILSEKANN